LAGLWPWQPVLTCLGALSGAIAGCALANWTTTAALAGHVSHSRSLLLTLVAAVVVALGAGQLGVKSRNGRRALGILTFAIGFMGLGLPVWSAGVLGWSLGLVAGARAGRRATQAFTRGWLERHQPNSVRDSAVDVARRLHELRGHALRIASLRHRIERDVPGEARLTALRALEAASVATQRQQERCEVERWRLDMARWQNGLQPLLRDWRGCEEAECHRRLAKLETAWAAGRELAAQWAGSGLAASAAGGRTLATLERLLGACEELQHALLLRAAVSIAADSPGVHEAFGNKAMGLDDAPEIELLRERTALAEYLADPDDAEETSARLEAELQAIAEVEQLVARRR